MKNSIKFIYFDLGGVMFRWRGVYQSIVLKHKRSLEEVEKTYLRYDAMSCRGQITPAELWQGFCQDLKITKEKDFDFIKHAISSFTPIPETHRLVKKLIHHFPIGLLTNIHHGFFDLAIKHGQIPVLSYQAVVKSCELGFIKPEKEIYHHAQKKARVPHENILFIDDYEENIIAAKELGWQTVLFDTDNPAKSIRQIDNLLK